MHMCVCVCVCARACMYMWVCVGACVHTCASMCMSAYCVYVHMWVMQMYTYTVLHDQPSSTLCVDNHLKYIYTSTCVPNNLELCCIYCYVCFSGYTLLQASNWTFESGPNNDHFQFVVMQLNFMWTLLLQLVIHHGSWGHNEIIFTTIYRWRLNALLGHTFLRSCAISLLIHNYSHCFL